jgi:hypothetical protein
LGREKPLIARYAWLLRRQPRFVSRRFAECQKLSKLIAKFGKRSIVDGARCITHGQASLHERFALLLPHSVPFRKRSAALDRSRAIVDVRAPRVPA